MKPSTTLTMIAVAAVALIGVTTLAAQTKPDPQSKPEQKTTSPAPTQDVVVLDASSQLSQLKGAQLGGSGKMVTAVPINLMQAPGYRPGLDVVAFRFAGTLDGKSSGALDKGDKTPPGEGQPNPSTSAKGSGTVILQGIVSTRPDLTQDELRRIAHGGGEIRKDLPPVRDPAKDPKDPTGKDPNDPTGKDPTKGGLDDMDSPDATGALLFECRTASMQPSGTGRTFEVIGCQSADPASKLSADRIAEIKRRLSETGATAHKDPAAAPAGESKSPTVGQALDSIEKGKAFLYVNVLPDLPTLGKDPSAASAPMESFVLKDVTLVFAAVAKSAP
jgi:hypothetical protein